MEKTIETPPGSLLNKNCDIFCSIIDNFGDIGFALRLARALCFGYGYTVRLFVDDIQSFNKISGLTVSYDQSTIISNHNTNYIYADTNTSISIYNMDCASSLLPQPLVIETFGCTLPEAFQDKMLNKQQKILWINIEYLSTEPWTEELHLTHSLVNSSNKYLKKLFFFPGITNKSGGIIYENYNKTIHSIQTKACAIRPNQYESIPNTFMCLDFKSAKHTFFNNINVEYTKYTKCISIFCYKHTFLLDNLLTLSESFANLDTESTILVLITDCAFTEQLNSTGIDLSLNKPYKLTKNIHLQLIPWMTQDSYDVLLCCCDANVVRGEDSFVRALLSGKPFVWHIYKQQDNVHIDKLLAFMDTYFNIIKKICHHNVNKQAIYDIQNMFMNFNIENDNCNLNTLFNKTMAYYAKIWQTYLQNNNTLQANIHTLFCNFFAT